jgi:hypothetical protein
MKTEIAIINTLELNVDVGLLNQDQLFFNATELSKPFGKRPDDFWKQQHNVEYCEALITLSQGNKNNFVVTRKGKYGGTWLHQDLALAFARWLSPLFAVRLDKWIGQRLIAEQQRKEARLVAKTGRFQGSCRIN